KFEIHLFLKYLAAHLCFRAWFKLCVSQPSSCPAYISICVPFLCRLALVYVSPCPEVPFLCRINGASLSMMSKPIPKHNFWYRPSFAWP
uniref:Uncharacterized protein n=1 Tax=Neogobius melanostomus TaxID=47308 RepID=A0A8C6SBC6_9GOBI